MEPPPETRQVELAVASSTKNRVIIPEGGLCEERIRSKLTSVLVGQHVAVVDDLASPRVQGIAQRQRARERGDCIPEVTELAP